MCETNKNGKCCISIGIIVIICTIGLMYFPIRFLIVEPSIKISNINNDIETECTVTNIEKCNNCTAIGNVYIEFNFNIDSENKNVTTLVQCDVYYNDNSDQICSIYSLQLKVNAMLPCYYNPDGELYLYTRNTTGQGGTIFGGIFLISIPLCFIFFIGWCIIDVIRHIMKKSKKNKDIEMKKIKSKKTNKYENLEESSVEENSVEENSVEENSVEENIFTNFRNINYFKFNRTVVLSHKICSCRT